MVIGEKELQEKENRREKEVIGEKEREVIGERTNGYKRKEKWREREVIREN